MSEKSRLTELAEHRKLLLLEADLHRSVLTLELEKLRTALSELSAARQRVTHSPWVVAGGAVAGLMTLRYWRKFKQWAPVAVSTFRWIKSLKQR